MKKFFIFFILLTGATGLIWMKPSLILTPSRVNRIFKSSLGEYFSKLPATLNLTIKPNGFFGKQVLIEASYFCLKEPEACFKQFKVEFRFRLIKLTRIRINEIGPVEILNESLTYTVPKQTEIFAVASPTPSFDLKKYVEIPSRVSIKDIQIDFPKVKWIQDKEIIFGELNLSGKESASIDLTANASSKEGFKGALELHTSFIPDRRNPFHSMIQVKKGIGQISGKLDGEMEWTTLSGTIEGNLAVKRFIPWIHTLYVKNLKIDHEDNLRLRADLETKLDQELSFGHSQSILPKVTLSTQLKGNVVMTAENDSIHYKIGIGPTQEKGVSLEASASGRFPIPSEVDYKYGIDHFQCKLQIPQFQKLVQSLRKTNYSIPAPFSALKGNVLFHLQNENLAQKEDTLSGDLMTNLDSSEQTFKTKSKVTLKFAPPPTKLKVSGETKIELIRITLPDLKVLEPTPLEKTDLPIISPHQAKMETSSAKDAPIDFSWQLSTHTDGVKIYHPIFNPYAPIEANWNFGTQNEGSIELKPFEIKYLNRVAQVKALRIYQKLGNSKFYYDGKIVIVKTDYTIFVNIIQEGERPKIALQSDPPLGQGDIISVLLFNQTSAQLDADQTSSVASTQSAVTNRALGLFSILALSSTPVEAVNFNPATGIYSARIKLANGLTATVGTDWDKNQEVALRKRLGKNFVLSTILQSDPETNSETRKTLIEWFKRF